MGPTECPPDGHKYRTPPPLSFPFPSPHPLSSPRRGFPTMMMSPETAFAIPFPVLDSPCFFEPQDFSSIFDQLAPYTSTFSGPTPAWSDSPPSDSPPSDPPSAPADERKRRRMISNRESARRSRMRKQRHLEDLRNQVSRLRSENRDVSSRLATAVHHFQLLRHENDRLRAEYAILRQRLLDIRRFLFFRQLQHLVSSNQQIPQL